MKSFPDRERITCENVSTAAGAAARFRLLHALGNLRWASIAFVVGTTSLCAFGSLIQWQSPGLLLGAGNGIARWLANAESGSDVEKALYRLMKLPGGEALYRRSPRETRPELTALLAAGENRAPLYSLRAMEDEQALDFDAAERDWKTWAEKADDKVAAHLDLADFYDRRLKPHEELAALEVVGEAAANPRERWTAADSERSWKAWKKSLIVIDRFALPRSLAEHVYAGWEHRYPGQKEVYERELSFELEGKNFTAVSDLIARYRKVFPGDELFPVRAEAQLEAGRGSPQNGLAVFDKSFQPLWPAELVKSYYELLVSGHQTLKTRDVLRARLEAHPDGGADALKDAAKLFYIFQAQGQLDAAKAVLAGFRTRKDARGAAWTAEELFTLGRLLEQVQDFPEAARYYYALASDKKTPGAEQKGLAGLTRILLTAPEQPLRLGAGNLAFYKSIATMDRGPGYLNGILSLFLNSQAPASEYSSQSQLAVPYFHRAKAAELLAEIDKRFPSAPERPELHARLMDAFAAYGENDAVIREGTAFLAQFPSDGRRVEVALAVGDVYSRTNQPEKEFALYRGLLKELAAKADGVPLGVPGPAYSKPVDAEPVIVSPVANPPADADADADAVPPQKVEPASNARSADYARVLDRYLSRLVAIEKLPDALALLRGELDRNPQDPGLYEKLAEFLEQNRLNAHEEDVYQRAIEQFQDTGFGMGWYGKLARFYLRQRRNADYSALSKKVIATFSGTDLEEYLREAPAPDRTLALEVDRYAHDRFPHDLTFVRNLLAQYRTRRQQSEVEKLLWEHWAESPDLRDQLFELLSSSGRLDAQLDALKQQSPEIDKADWAALAQSNPAAERFWMESCLWQSRFEQATGAAGALAAEYPADASLGQTASSLYRSLAYFHFEDTDKAVTIEKRLLDAKPDDLETMARIGDIYADRGRMAEAEPYWIRMAEVRPGDADGYLQSATVFWDYFDFPISLAQLRKGRERLADPAAFGYQAGAIEESQGNAGAAIKEYVASALADKPSEESRNRLLSLARRSATRAAVDAETVGLLKSATPTTTAINLRVSVLDVQHRNADMVQELKQAAAQTESFDVLDALGEAARVHGLVEHGLAEVEQTVLNRQIALTADPVHNLELHYQLVDLLEQHNPAGAATEVDTVYREHGKILGVVRATVDFDWEHERRAQAVSVLLDSADGSYPDLKQQFQLEAARKLTALGEFSRSKGLLDSLLSQKPLDAAVEAAMADNYAHSGDQAGLEAFYRAELAAVRSSNMESGEKTQRLAQLRRGMIGAASLLGNWGDAVDQYIELINSYPGDAALAEEAALAAGAHGQRDKLTGFYRTTVEASPRDARWSIVLARLQTALEDYPAAIEAYGKAIRVRPEQKDLYEAKASLEERLHNLDDAVADYQQLYKLSYRDPQWMEKAAEARARQGRNDDAVKALTEAWINGRPIKADNYFRVASRLEQWGLLDEARKFAEQGADAAGADLLVDPGNQSGAVIYARVMARLRQSDAAFTRLAIARQRAENVPLTAVAEQVVKQGLAAVTDEDWRKQRIAQRTAQAKAGFAQALRSMAAVVGEYGTPEEKAQFESWLQAKQSTAANGSELRDVYLPAIQAAGLVDMQADLLWELIEKSGDRTRGLSEWLQFERSRGRLEEAGPKIEALAASAPATQKAAILAEASEVYRTVGDTPAELRTMDRLAAMRGANDDPRYFHLLLDSRPQDLLQRASGSLTTSKASRDFAAQFLVANAKPDLALNGVAARSSGLPRVWKKAYTGLTGLYLREHTSQVRQSFDGALGGDATIGERIAHPTDRNEQLAGEVWFYYGSRYGEYLDEEKDSLAESYLQSELEHTPENAAAYSELADYSAQAGRAEPALVDYRHSLDLKSDQPAILDSIAVLEWKQGRHPEALASWQMAVKRLADEMDARHVPESFWGDFTLVLGDAAANGQYAAISQQVDTMLRVYLARNGVYRVESLLEAGYHANGDHADWLLEITSAASDPEYVLSSLWRSNWIVKSQASQILSHIVELDRQKPEAKPEDESWELEHAESNLVDALLDEKKYAAARAELAHIPAEKRKSSQGLNAELRLDEADGLLAGSLAQWKKHPETAPASNDLRNAVELLAEPSKRIVLRFVYERALEGRDLTAPNFLGLAAIDLDEGDVPGAVTLLRRLTMISGNPYADLDSAASLLETRGRSTEAIQFLQPLVDAFPWEASYKVRFAKATLEANAHAQRAVSMLAGVAADPKAKYADRLAASKALRGQNAAGAATGSAELDILVRGSCPSLEQAARRFFVDTRIAAAACAADDKTRESILASALAIAPANDAVRLAYVWAAFGSGQDSRALVAVEPILSSNTASYDPRFSPGDGSSDDQDAGSTPAAPTPSAMKPEEAAKLAWYAIRAREKRQEPEEALKLVQSAMVQERDDSRHRAFKEEKKRLETDAAREEENEARAPKIHVELDQDRVVHPRLLPGMAFVPRKTANSEGDVE